jgi:hypothetical protein
VAKKQAQTINERRLKPKGFMKAKRNLIQTCLLCAVILPVAVQAHFAFTTNIDGTITITGYCGPGGDVTIPGSNNGCPIIT